MLDLIDRVQSRLIVLGSQINLHQIIVYLNEADGISIPELARKVNLSVESTALAVGWLARENKVVIERKNGLIEIYNEGHFDFSFG